MTKKDWSEHELVEAVEAYQAAAEELRSAKERILSARDEMVALGHEMYARREGQPTVYARWLEALRKEDLRLAAAIATYRCEGHYGDAHEWRERLTLVQDLRKAWSAQDEDGEE